MAQQKSKSLLIKIPGTTGIPSSSLVVFTRQLSTMIDAGLPIVQALELLASQEPNPHFQIVLRDIKSNVESGMTFGDALKKHPRIFDSLYQSLVVAGEAGGVLDVILGRLSLQIEKSEKLKRKVKSAMTYPIGILIVAVIIVIVMLYKVIPTFKDMFSNMGDGQLPELTQNVINLSENFSENFLIYMLIIIAIPTTFILLMKNYSFKKTIHAIILKTPIFGLLTKKTAVARFTRTMGTMLTSGVPLLEALNIVADSSGNILIKEAILKVRDSVSTGTTLSDPLAAAKIFPEMVVQMISVGEATGALDVMMNKIADFYDDEVDAAISSLTQLIEPLMMVFIGIIVGVLLLSMYLPIFSMGDAIGV